MSTANPGIQSQRDIAVTQLVHELVDQFLVDEIQKCRPRFDQGHRDVERAEDGGVFDADHARADDGEAARQFRQVDDLIAVEHRPAVERHVIRPEWPGATCDQDVGGGHHASLAAFRRHLDLVCPDKTRLAACGFHRIAAELMLQHLDFMIERLLQPGDQVDRADILLHPVGPAVEAALAPARKIEHRLAQGL